MAGITMSGSQNYECAVRILSRIRGDHYLLTSPDLPGFFLAGPDLRALLADTPEAIRKLWKLNFGMDMEVTLLKPASMAGAEDDAMALPPAFSIRRKDGRRQGSSA